MKTLYSILALFLLIFISAETSRSQQIIQWNNYSAYFRISCMLDLDTAVLAGTDFNGLVSINKATNQVYYINNSNSDFRGNIIHALAKDASGQIWVGSYCGLAVYSGGNWIQYTTQNSNMPVNGVTALHYSLSTNSLWVGYENGYIMEIDTSGWNIIIGQNGSMPSGRIISLLSDNSGKIYAGSFNAGVYIFDGTNWINYYTSNSTLTNILISMAIDTQGNLWVANTWKLNKFDGTNWSMFSPPFTFLEYISCDSNDVVWISSQAGVRTFDGTTFNYLPFNVYLTSHDITCHLWDKNFFWTGTFDNGVDHIALNTTNVTNFPLVPGIPYPLVNSIDFEPTANKVWFGTPISWGNGPMNYSCILSNFDGSSWEQYNRINSPLLSNSLQSICTDTNQTVWIGTADTGLYCLHGSSWSHFTKQNSDLHADEISTLGKDTGLGLLIGFEDGTIQTLQGTIFQTIITSSQTNSTIKKIISDATGVIWIATESSGIFKYSTSLLNNYNAANVGLPSNHINDIKIDTLQHFWIATDAGVVYYDGVSSWTTYNTSNSGLPDNDVNAIAIGLDNSLWVGLHYDGISHYDGTNWTHYMECDSKLAGNTINEMKTDANGDIYIGTNRGANRIRIDYITGENVISEPQAVKVYPNPGSGIIKFEHQTTPNSKATFQIFNTIGQMIYQRETSSNNNGEINLSWDISTQPNSIPPGLYFYTFQSKLGTTSGKFVIAK